MTCGELLTMTVAKQRHDRSLVVAHYKLIGSLFKESDIDLGEFLARGVLGPPALPPIPASFSADVERKIKEIQSNGGKLIVEG